MASPQGINKLFANNSYRLYDHDPGASTAVVVSPDGGTTKRVADMALFSHFAVVAMSSTLTGAGITKLEIIASESSDMANPVVIRDSGVVAADAVGDYVGLECSAEQLAQEGTDSGKHLRYAAGRLTLANAADEAVVLYVLSGARFPADGLFANFIS